MLIRIRLFVATSLMLIILFCCVMLVYASASPPQGDSISSKDIIMILFGLLQTVFMGIGLWLISNDKELFTRMAKVESKQNTRDALCEERNLTNPDHHHNRVTDHNTEMALKETVDTLRRLLFAMDDKNAKKEIEP